MKTEAEILQEQPGYELLPYHVISGMYAYIEMGIPPGGFLTAVLQNDLMGAAAQADLENRHRLFDYCMFLYNHAPVMCYGSKDKIAEWILRGGKRGSHEKSKSDG